MIKFVIALLFVVADTLARPQYEIVPQVVGGMKAQEGEHPYAVSLRSGQGSFFCGGSLISDRHVLTAAHCVTGSGFKVGLGSVFIEKQELVPVQKATAHPNYKPSTMQNDIAVVTLKSPVTLSDKVKTISLDFDGDADNVNVTAVGWGRMGSDKPVSKTLLYLKRSTISNKECSKRMGNSKIGDGHLCLGTERNFGMCFGDSGSPLVHRHEGKDYVLGALSWGIPCATGLPDVYSRVSHFRDWIKETMK